jgi:hypothetical protein
MSRVSGAILSKKLAGPEIAKRAMLGAAQSRRDLVSAGASGKHMNKRIGPPMPPVLHAGSRRNSANIQKAAVPGFEPKKRQFMLKNQWLTRDKRFDFKPILLYNSCVGSA